MFLPACSKYPWHQALPYQTLEEAELEQMQVPPWLLSVTACSYINKCIQLEQHRVALPLLILPAPSGAAEPLGDSWEVSTPDDSKQQHTPQRLTPQLNSEFK